jgi:DNA-directed RNA polymerase specialized sigma subunit
MTVKEYLSRYHKTKENIQKLQALVNEYIRHANEIPGVNFDAIRADGTRKLEAPFEKWILKTLDYENEIKEMRHMLPIYKRELLSSVEQLENKEFKMIILHRYIDWLSWRQIAERMFLSSATIRRWHDKALNEITF